jgi:aspartyl-tRNA(Asn)/glutamyl-tRNA(Gln) amidotransferase subunit A
MDLTGRTLASLGRDLASGATTSVALVEAALAAIEADDRAFTRIHAAAARAAAKACDAQRAQGLAPTPFAGAPISVKDLFDVAGEPTPAGSTILSDAAPAAADAPAVARLRAAGLIVVGRTQMSEFAFTGIGLNPHGRQPENPRAPGRVPGGSSSGAAVSVGRGQSVAGLGTDTGGSVRVPAAFCGLTGFKPTARRITRKGTFPLSTSLDSIGPIANSVACCRSLDAILADDAPPVSPAIGLAGLRIGVPREVLVEDLEAPVAAAFEAALARLSAAGAHTLAFDFPELRRIVEVNTVAGTLANAEAFALHRRLGLLQRRADYDPNVLTRVLVGQRMTAADYIDLVEARAAIIAAAAARTAPFDVVVAPTAPILAPRIDAVAEPTAFARWNGLALRNTIIVNFLDGCAISLPMATAGQPCGLMAIGPRFGDERLLAIAEAMESVVTRP